MNKFLVVFLLALVACENFDTMVFKEFQRFITLYDKKYNSVQEYLARFNVFRQNFIEVVNEPPKTYTTGITKFSDLTKQEFAKTYLNLDITAQAFINLYPIRPTSTNAAPDAFDWRDKGAVATVKDQASCGSCWAFATCANLEGLYYLNKKVMKDFAPQHLVDCDTIDAGCNGGLMENSFTWIKESGGIMLEEDYPYVGYKQTCKEDKTKYVDMKVTGYVKLGDAWESWTPADENEVKELLYETGPLAIALNANLLQTYTGGIIDADKSKCSPYGLNHAVTLVGYGHDEETDLDYWLVKNSWGETWGEEGYFRIARGKGTCGIDMYITTAQVSF